MIQADIPARDVAEKLQTVLAKIEKDSGDLCSQLHLSLSDSATSSLQHLLLYADTTAALEVCCPLVTTTLLEVKAWHIPWTPEHSGWPSCETSVPQQGSC